MYQHHTPMAVDVGWGNVVHSSRRVASLRRFGGAHFDTRIMRGAGGTHAPVYGVSKRKARRCFVPVLCWIKLKGVSIVLNLVFAYLPHPPWYSIVDQIFTSRWAHKDSRVIERKVASLSFSRYQRSKRQIAISRTAGDGHGRCVYSFSYSSSFLFLVLSCKS